MFVIMAIAAATLSRANAQTQTIIGTVSGGIPTLTASASTLMIAIEGDLNDGTDITDVYIEASLGVYYLVGVGDNNGACVRRGYLLNEGPGGNLKCADAQTHTCTGVCCTSCAFSKDAYGNINGCQPCQAAPSSCSSSSYCNHSVSTSTTGGYIGSFY